VLHRLILSGSDRHASTWQHSVHISTSSWASGTTIRWATQ
jgi:hypothetical protein